MRSNTALKFISNETLKNAQSPTVGFNDLDSALQKSLEFDQIISTFSKKIMQIVPHTAYMYVNYDMDQSFKNGIFTEYSCNYALRFDKRPLGELRLMRHYKFEESDLKLLEALLCSLIYPLNNATLYYMALKMAKLPTVDTLLHVNQRPTESYRADFSQGVNAFVEHNRKLYGKKPVAATTHGLAEDPWQMSFYR